MARPVSETTVDALIDRDRLAETLTALIAEASVNPFGRPPVPPTEGEARAIDYVENRLGALGWRTETVEFAPGRPSLVAHAPHTSGTTVANAVVLAGHVDTVAVDGYDEPFSGRCDGTRVWGRGACDMKAAIACYLEVAEVLATPGAPPLDGPLVIAAVADEEHEQRGAKSVRALLPPAELVVIGEPTELRICTASKGLAAFTLTVDGRATHGSVPGEGRNAIERAAELIDGLRAHASELEAEKHPLLGAAILNIGVVRGGSRANVVPPTCELEVSRRLLPHETAASAHRRMQEALQQHCGTEQWSLSESWWTVDPYENADRAIVAAFQAAGDRSGLDDTTATGFPASSDAPYFGAPAVICGPGSLSQAHSLDEWVSLDDLVAATRLYLQFIRDRLTRAGTDERT